MSGGSWDYVCYKVEEAADRLLATDGSKSCRNERIALGKVLRLAAAALHDIEWVDSSDYKDGDERAAILKVVSRNEVVLAATEQLREEIERAKAVLAAAETKT